MTEVHYNRAPILEAIIDIQVRFQTTPQQSTFLEMAQAVSERFPQSTPVTHIGFGMGIAPAGPTVTPPSIVASGVRLATAKNDRVLLVQPRGFSFSHMPPYTEWRPFRDEAMDLWGLFTSIVKPEMVTRTALRYINRFEIPHERFELSDYFCFRPEIPNNGIPHLITAFFTQCQVQQPDIGPDVTAIMNLGSAGTAPSGAQQILLDFDVFATRQMEPNSAAVIELMDQLRRRKNDLFEACITDRARELIR